MWWHTSIIPALRRLRQEELELKAKTHSETLFELAS
jgi:hypothetical protein